MEQNHALPENIGAVIKQLKEMGQRGEVNFALAFAYRDENKQYWFEAHAGGSVQILKSLFADDTNAEAMAKLNLIKKKKKAFIYFSTPRSPLTLPRMKNSKRH